MTPMRQPHGTAGQRGGTAGQRGGTAGQRGGTAGQRGGTAGAAEPMVADFGRCFAGITDGDTVLALADSSRLDHCVVRDRLAALASAARPPAGLRPTMGRS